MAQKSPLCVAEIRERIFASPEHEAFERGEIRGTEFYTRVAAKTGLRMSYQEFFDAWADIFWPEEPMLDLAAALRERYVLYLLSNTNEIHYTEFLRIPRLMEIIPRHGLSFKLKAIKPEFAVYKRFFEQFHICPEESIFIDDTETNVRGARWSGLHAIRHKDLQSTCRALARFGVVV